MVWKLGELKEFGDSKSIQRAAIGTASCHRLFHSVNVSWWDHIECATGIRPFWFGLWWYWWSSIFTVLCCILIQAVEGISAFKPLLLRFVAILAIHKKSWLDSTSKWSINCHSVQFQSLISLTLTLSLGSRHGRAAWIPTESLFAVLMAMLIPAGIWCPAVELLIIFSHDGQWTWSKLMNCTGLS